MLRKIGFTLFLVGLVIIGLTFYPVFKVEVDYKLQGPGSKSEELVATPVDEDFGIVIPKIRANSKVVVNVDPFDSLKYQRALTTGVAHAQGSALPDLETGNTFIFSHSSVNFYEALTFNSVFYLLDKLEKEDEIIIYYKGQKYLYKVTERKVVSPADVSYLSAKSTKKTVTLMTCWPAGTTFKRLIVVGEAT